MGKTLESERNIRSIASRQQGYFTAKQASEAGYSYAAQYHQVAVENWVREARGIYRIADYTRADRPDLVLWSLWSSNRQGKPQGVYSHETALSIHDLSDVMPASLHMTVPPSFRKSAKIPKVLVIHRAILTATDIQEMDGYSVTRPLRTIIDVACLETMSVELLEQAVRQALQRGLLKRDDLAKAAELEQSPALAGILRGIIHR
jgi:predicted transcriptional regulator of viral defense system